MLRPDLRTELELLRDLGHTHLDLRRARAARGDEADSGSLDELPAGEASTRLLEGVPRPEDVAPIPLLSQLEAAAKRCILCRLSGTRTQVVFGTGNPAADLLFVGEAPGRDEDLEGEPFVGRAGKLLTDIIGAMKLSRDEVYIANVIKCRPPGNRNPEPDEMAACRPWLDRQIELIAPKVIVTLGKFAAQRLLGRSVAITAVRGEWQIWRGIRVMPTYHPAYLLRTPSAKKDVWKDMQQVMVELGIAL
ncbi:MAG TPA: uracil-DNA glycosylase [Thermoanaerobaculia bacterium]|nr:uracil-DNA glycosylase [Thermoanaerobaculia bacterium]